MPRIKNLKEHILKNAQKIAMQESLASINMREIAKASGVALGTIYNYYPTKGDLLADIVALFWQDAFADIDFIRLQEMDFQSALRYIYFELLHFLNSFKSDWLQQLSLLSKEEKSAGREKEKEYLSRVYSTVLSALCRNASAVQNYTYVEREYLAQFIFDAMLAMLRKGEQDFTLFEKIIDKILS